MFLLMRNLLFFSVKHSIFYFSDVNACMFRCINSFSYSILSVFVCFKNEIIAFPK